LRPFFDVNISTAEHLLPREDIPRLRKLRLSENRISQMRQDHNISQQPRNEEHEELAHTGTILLFDVVACCGAVALRLSVDPV